MTIGEKIKKEVAAAGKKAIVFREEIDAIDSKLEKHVDDVTQFTASAIEQLPEVIKLRQEAEQSIESAKAQVAGDRAALGILLDASELAASAGKTVEQSDNSDSDPD